VLKYLPILQSYLPTFSSSFIPPLTRLLFDYIKPLACRGELVEGRMLAAAKSSPPETTADLPSHFRFSFSVLSPQHSVPYVAFSAALFK